MIDPNHSADAGAPEIGGIACITAMNTCLDACRDAITPTPMMEIIMEDLDPKPSKPAHPFRMIPKEIARRIKRYMVKLRKKTTYLARWDLACHRLWMSFLARPATYESLRRMERNHNRLMRVFNDQGVREIALSGGSLPIFPIAIPGKSRKPANQ
jgi:hypothetical protein